MKQVYKCDFCFTTNENDIVILEHEQNCQFNPIHKSCSSCQHFNCAVAVERDYDHCKLNVINFQDIREDNLPCDKWEWEKS